MGAPPAPAPTEHTGIGGVADGLHSQAPRSLGARLPRRHEQAPHAVLPHARRGGGSCRPRRRLRAPRPTHADHRSPDHDRGLCGAVARSVEAHAQAPRLRGARRRCGALHHAMPRCPARCGPSAHGRQGVPHELPPVRGERRAARAGIGAADLLGSARDAHRSGRRRAGRRQRRGQARPPVPSPADETGASSVSGAARARPRRAAIAGRDSPSWPGMVSAFPHLRPGWPQTG